MKPRPLKVWLALALVGAVAFYHWNAVRKAYNSGRDEAVAEYTEKAKAAEAAYQAAVESVRSLKAALQDRRAALALAEKKLADASIRAPVAGRIEYRVVEPGSVIPSGGRVATLLNISDVYMTVFLPTSIAGKLAGGLAVVVEPIGFNRDMALALIPAV